MASVIDICNLALGNIEAGSINALTENNDKARACKLRYPIARDAVLSDAWWNFAAKTAYLAQLSDAPVEYSYQYSLPSDYLQARYVVPQTGSGTDGLIRERYDGRPEPAKIEFEIGISDASQRVLMTNEDSVYLRYTFQQTDTTLFSPQFVVMLGWLLAAEIAVPVVGKKSGRELRKDAFSVYSGMLNAALATDEMEHYLGKGRDPELIEVRQT